VVTVVLFCSILPTILGKKKKKKPSLVFHVVLKGLPVTGKALIKLISDCVFENNLKTLHIGTYTVGNIAYIFYFIY